MQRLRVGFLSSLNYFDRNAWSGVLYSMHQALMSVDIEVINLGYPSKPSRWNNLVNRLKNFGKKDAFSSLGSPDSINEYKKFTAGVQKQILKNPCDVIYVPLGDNEVNYLETDIPIVKLSDTTFPLLQKDYQLNLQEKEIEWIVKQEARALAKANKLIYPSKWAANSAINEYQIDPAKIEVIPFGANVEYAPLVSEVISPKSTSRCRLLFVAKEWQRKGGDIAFQTLIALQELGIDAELTVVGTVPPDELKNDKLTVFPFLSKNEPNQRQQLYNLFLTSNFLLSPTRADCSPMIVAESNAFGLPVIITDVGGIPDLIREGKNGYMLPLSASTEEYAKLIAAVFSDHTRYKNLVRSSKEEYDTRLNWNKWAQNLQRVLTSVVKERAVSRQRGTGLSPVSLMRQ